MWIKTIPPAEAGGPLAELYRRAGNPDGTVDNVMRVHSLNPESLRTHFEMYAAAMHGDSPLSRAERELVAVAVSRLNGCEYCRRHHLAGLLRRWPDERRHVGEAVASGRVTTLTDREQALVGFASKLTMNPHGMDAADVETLRGAGLDDRAVLDLVQVVGYFNYVNRVVNGLGVAAGGEEGEPGQWPGGSD